VGYPFPYCELSVQECQFLSSHLENRKVTTKCTGHKECLIFLYNFRSKQFSVICILIELRLEAHRRTHTGLHVWHLLLLTDFNQNWEVSTSFGKTLQYQNFTKNCSANVELLHADRRTYGDSEANTAYFCSY
jgi:hypothetical protein